jgi:hypothetical protein
MKTAVAYLELLSYNLQGEVEKYHGEDSNPTLSEIEV